jgi:hypothetical protein
MKMSISLLSAVVLGFVVCAPASGGLLDRIKEKASDAARSTREVTRDVEAVKNVDERVTAEGERAVRGSEAAVDDKIDVEGRARARATDTEIGRSAAQVEREVGRVESTAAEIERQTDVEARAESAARGSPVVEAITETQREVGQAQSDVNAAGRVAQDPAGAVRQRADQETGGAVHAVQDVGAAVQELGAAID